MSEESIEKLREQLENEENGLALLKENRKFINEQDEYNINRNEEMQQECEKEIIKLRISINNFNIKNRFCNTVFYGDINFDLHHRTLEIGTMCGPNKIKNIDKFNNPQTNLGKKTPTTIMLLYCIVVEAQNGNFDIKDYFSDYNLHIAKYRSALGINKKTIPNTSSLADYLSSLNALLKIYNSKYEITHKKGGKPKTFEKIKPLKK